MEERLTHYRKGGGGKLGEVAAKKFKQTPELSAHRLQNTVQRPAKQLKFKNMAGGKMQIGKNLENR
jgi:hypothetical protein